MNRIFTILLFLSALFGIPAHAQQVVTVSGRVTDESGQPVIGAVVIAAGNTSTAAITALDGRYSIKCHKGEELSFSSLGYVEYKTVVGDVVEIDVVMKTDAQQLEDVVVIAYGTQAKSDVTGAVSVINMEDIEVPMLSVDQALQGRVAGLEVTTTSGEPGAAASLQVRGTRSISASNEPLIVVDGVVDAVSSFSDINPSDIKSMSVLKDVSSTALYGARGANGVIIVTTKDGGKAENLQVTFKADAGVSSLLRRLDIMDATEYSRYRNDVIYNYRLYNGYSSTATAPQVAGSIYPIEQPLLKGKGTDWVDVLTQTAIKQNYNLSASMGKGRNRTYASLGYSDEDGIIIGTGTRRMTGSLRVNRAITPKITGSVGFSFTIRDTDRNKARINGNSSTAAVCLSPLLTTGDMWNKYGDTSGGTIFNNPYLSAVRETNRQDMNYINFSPRLEWAPVKGLMVKTSFSYYLKYLRNFYYSPSSLPTASYRKTGGTAERSITRTDNYLWETTATWKKSYRKKHNFDIMGGFTVQDTNDDYSFLRGIGYLDDSITYKNMGSVLDSRNLYPTTTIRHISRMSGIGRFNYSYKKLYYLTLTGRADGSSNFAEGNKWAFFPAAAVKWNISNEKFMKKARRKGLTELALRLSSGRSGNDAIPAYLSQAALTNSSTGWLFGSVREVAYYPTRLDNSNLTWEKTDSFNAGLDIDLKGHRFIINADAYISRTTDLLLTVKNAATTGFTQRYNNVGGTLNKGVEFSFSSKNISTRNFLWATTVTASHNRQMVTDTGAGNEYIPTFSVGSSQMVYGYVKGYPANSLWGFQYGGVWHNEQELEDNKATHTYAGFKDRTGYAKYVDVNHDGLLNKDDWVYLGSADPVAYGGLQNKFTFRGRFTINTYFSWSYGGKVYNLTELWLGSGAPGTNAYRYMLNGWHPVRNPESDIPAPYTRDGFACDRYVHDASFIRFKTLSLSYSFPNRMLKHIKGLTAAVTADNLWLWSTYNGFDPDVSSSAKRLDNNAYPYPRTFTASLNIKF